MSRMTPLFLLSATALAAVWLPSDPAQAQGRLSRDERLCRVITERNYEVTSVKRV